VSPAVPPSTQSDPPRSRSLPSDSSRHRSSRRAFLAAAGTATATTLAGCNGPGSNDGAATFYDGDWSSYGNGPTNANRVAGGTPESADHETLAAGDLHELDAATGETTWQAHLPSEGTAAPVVTGESVVVAGDVRAYRRATGVVLASDRVRWRTSSVHATAFSSPVIAAGRVLVAGPVGLLALRPGADG
jgi:hypothetical protein